MLNTATIKTISDLRENPLAVLRAAKKMAEPIYVFYRSSPQAAIISIDDLNDLLAELEDLKDALIVLQRQQSLKRKLVPWKKVKKDLSL